MEDHTYIAIDPGTEKSAFVIFDSNRIRYAATDYNVNILSRLRASGHDHLAIEMVQSFGKPVGQEVFATCVWIGRFIGAFNGPHTLLTRSEIKMHLCQQVVKINDAIIRQRLIDIYGGKQAAIGLKKTPGPLYGFKGDEWQALAVAETWKAKMLAKV